MLRRALEQLQWTKWRCSLHLYVGGTPESGALDAWSPYLGGVDLLWSTPELVDRDGDWAWSDDVFRHVPEHADVFVTLDADTLPVRSLEPILDQVVAADVVAGVVAHYPTILPFDYDERLSQWVCTPTPEWPEASVRAAWRRLAQGVVDAELGFEHTHSLMGPDVPRELREAPFDPNFGVVFFPRVHFERIAPG